MNSHHNNAVSISLSCALNTAILMPWCTRVPRSSHRPATVVRCAGGIGAKTRRCVTDGDSPEGAEANSALNMRQLRRSHPTPSRDWRRSTHCACRDDTHVPPLFSPTSPHPSPLLEEKQKKCLTRGTVACVGSWWNESVAGIATAPEHKRLEVSKQDQCDAMMQDKGWHINLCCYAPLSI